MKAKTLTLGTVVVLLFSLFLLAACSSPAPEATVVPAEVEEEVAAVADVVEEVAEETSVEEATAVVIQSTVNCDDRWDLIDAVLIKQYDAIIAVATTDCTLPLTNQAVYLPECDVNSDDVCGLVEAVIIQQCNAGLVNPFCTDLE